MKILSLLIAFLLCLYYPQKQRGIKKIILGKFHYDMYIKKSYSHDENWNSEFFILCRAGTSKELCSAYLSATRNDSTFIKGHYAIYNNEIEFTECYYYYKNNSVWIDSLKKKFRPDKNGGVLLKETIEFKNGKAKTTINK